MRQTFPAAATSTAVVAAIVVADAVGWKKHETSAKDSSLLVRQLWAPHSRSKIRPNVSVYLRRERALAEDRWLHGRGLLWFQHVRRAGGTSLCQLLRFAVPPARFPPMTEACQPDEWKLRDAVAICDHNLSLVADEVEIIGGNSFAQEYGPMPAPALLGPRATPTEARMREWLFVLTLREPWSRFWSQLKYEMATCLMGPEHLAKCMGGDFEAIGHWWSPTAHPDAILGVPEARISASPALYIDNYYTRILLNRTDVSGPRLTSEDLADAKMLLRDRVSAVVILEDFGRTALQLVCSLGLDVERALPLLRTRVRPYEAYEQLMVVPSDEKELGTMNMKALRARFVTRNKFDYALYSYARTIAKQRLFECAARHPGVRKLWRAPASEFAEEVREQPKKAQEGDELPPEISIDDLFGCNGGRVETDEDGKFMLWCPRTADQHASSWWKSQATDGYEGPKRRKGQPLPGAECWKSGFTWAACCAPRFGPAGNVDCWNPEYTYERCCAAS